MPTNIDREGNYPLPDNLGCKPSYESFRRLWLNEFRNYDESYKHKDIEEDFERFAKQIYTYMVNNFTINMSSQVQELANHAYQDGWDDSRRDSINECIRELENKL